MEGRIATGIIPVAGLGTRLAPMTRALPKGFFPLVCPDGSVRPVTDWIVREAISAGCEQICLVVSPGQDAMLREYFAGEADLAGRIHYVTDVEPFGFGYAVWAARHVAGDGPVMVFLGDHVHLCPCGCGSPAAQVAEAFAANGPAAMVGVQIVRGETVERVGVCRGEPLEGFVYRCTRIVEKPTLSAAREFLVTPGLPKGKYLAHAGIYVFTAEIFDCLEPLVASRPEGAEVGLTEAQQELLARHRQDYLLLRIEGMTYDMGTPAGYLATQAALVLAAQMGK